MTPVLFTPGRWVDLRGADANALRERCVASHGVSFLPGTRCALEADAAA